MKIIFDSNEQKEGFFLSPLCCPRGVGLEEVSADECWKVSCEQCWQQAGVEIEVKQ